MAGKEEKAETKLKLIKKAFVMTMMMIMKLWDPHFVFCLSIFFENESSYLILIFFFNNSDFFNY